MKQIIQDLKKGNTLLEEVPVPQVKTGQLLIKTTRSLVSLGTERMLVEFGKANIIEKARQQPDKVKQVYEKLKTDGLLQTVSAIKSKLDKPISLGYCNAGVVLESSISGINKGDRVASNGPHAEIVRVSKNLCAKVPDNIDNETAAFTILGSIALQGVRLLNPTIGETIAIQGLGLVGLLAVQILKANGCRVIGIDYNRSRCEIAKNYGAEIIGLGNGFDPISFSNNITHENGIDGVLVCTASDNDSIMHQAAEMCRKRGRVVLVGTAGLNLRRDDFFKKEISFQVSASYGPGRYDINYEEKGQDYPIGFVRWTEQRNFEAVLQLMSEGKINVKPMITHRFPFADAERAYELIMSDKPSLGIVLEYENEEKQGEEFRKTTIKINPTFRKISGVPNLGFIGAGNYAGSVLIPAFRKLNVNLKSIASSGGISGAFTGKKFGFQETTTDTDSIFNDNDIDAIVVTTRHNSHADLVIKTLEAGKHVFVEKPLALKLDELENIKLSMRNNQSSILMVGFNRRFSPFILKMKEILKTANGPISMVMTVNAGFIPQDHWTQDPKIGGGRVVGEVCHFIDLIRYLVNNPISNYKKLSMLSKSSDTLTISLEFENGSIGTIHYLSNGHKSISKERLEVFFDGKVLQLDNFRKLKGYGIPGFSKMTRFRQDKGQLNCAKLFINVIKNGEVSPIPLNEILEVSKISIELSENI